MMPTMLMNAQMHQRPRREAPRGLLSRLAGNRLVRNNAIFFGGSVAAGALGYVFHFAIGRLLGPAPYSIVASAVAAVYLLTLPSLIVQLIAARFTSVAAARGEAGSLIPLLRLLTGTSVALGVVVALAFWVGGSRVAGFLQLSDRRVVAVLALSTLLGMLVATNRGLLQGLRRFGTLSLNLAIDGFTKVVVAVTLVLAGLGPLGAVVGILAGPVVAYLQALAVVGRLSAGPGKRVLFGEVARYAAPAAAAVIGVTYLFNIDVVLARHFLPATQAGIYAAGSVLGRAVYFLGLTVAAVMFPEVASRHARDQAHFHVVDLSLAFLAAVGAVLIVVYAVLPGLVLLPYGNQFTPVRPFLARFAAALTLLALSNLLVNYFLSVNSKRFIPPLLAAGVVETVLMALFHRDLGQLLGMLLLTTTLLTLSLSGLYLLDRFGAQVGAGAAPDGTPFAESSPV